MNLRQAVGRAGGRPLASYRRRRQRPVLSVVMPVHNVAEYLPAALDSALSQTFKALEVIAVDDGSTDTCPEILREYARRDYRVRVLRQDNAGQGIARNVGVRHARGEFLTFLDSDDVVPLDAYGAMVEGLQASGSDFSVGNLRRLRHGELQRMIWSRTVHRQDRIGTTIEEFPAAMQDIIACNRMFRTAFWRDRVGDFRGGIAYEDHVPMLTAYVRARRFDVLQRVTYHWRIREDLTSTGQQKARIGNLRDRIAVKEEARLLLLQEEAPEAVYAAWVGRALEVDFPPFLPFALAGDDEYRSLLAHTYRTFLDRVTPAALEHVRVAMRVRAHLAAGERWADLFDADDWLREVQNMPPTVVDDGRVAAAFPESCSWADALPVDERWMSPLECHVEAAAEHLVWSPDELALTGWVWLRGLDVRSPVVTAWLADGEERVPVAVRQVRLPEADVWSPLSFASPAEGGFEATVDLAALRQHGPRAWALVVRLEQDGLQVEGGVHHRVARSAASGPSSGHGVVARWDATTGLGLEVRPDARPGARDGVREVELEGATLVVTVDGAVAGAELATAGTVLTARDVTISGGSTRLELDLETDGTAAPTGTYDLVVGGGPASLGDGCAGSAPHRLHGTSVHVEVGQRPDGRAVFVLAPPLRDDEVGQVNRRRQVQRYREADVPVTDTVLLGSDGGRTASGDQLALDRWLAEHRPDVRRVWGVADCSVEVPEGSLPVLRGSREWYDALAGARLACHDEDLGPWVRRRDGQRLLRTFATHPFEPVGVELWRREGMVEHLVDREVHHRHREWDVVLAPDEQSAEFLRESFRWRGEVLVAGSPRTDPLVTGDRSAARARVLRRLGLPDTTLVLHAPAARDAHDLTRPEGRDDLDVAALARELGPSYTVLRRTEPGDRRPAPELDGVVDVSRYADLGDLLLACDVAVLDYGGIRFDWALTGRPAVFHVPDLDAWYRGRTTAFAWESSSVGPRVQTRAGVAACVRSATLLEATYADEVAAFNARFNPLGDGGATARVVAALLG